MWRYERATLAVRKSMSATGVARPLSLRMRPPGCCVQQLDLLRHHQRAELGGEALGEVLVGEHRGPVRAAAGVVLEFPEMDELVDHAGVALEVADQVLRMTAFFEGRK